MGRRGRSVGRVLIPILTLVGGSVAGTVAHEKNIHNWVKSWGDGAQAEAVLPEDQLPDLESSIEDSVIPEDSTTPEDSSSDESTSEEETPEEIVESKLRKSMHTELGKSYVDTYEAIVGIDEIDGKFDSLSALREDLANAQVVTKTQLKLDPESSKIALTKDDKAVLNEAIEESMLDLFYEHVAEGAQETFTGNYVKVTNSTGVDRKQTYIDLNNAEAYSIAETGKTGDAKYGKEASFISAEKSSSALETTITTGEAFEYQYNLGDGVSQETLQTGINDAGYEFVAEIEGKLSDALSWSEDMKFTDMAYAEDTYTLTVGDNSNSMTITVTIDDGMLTVYGVDTTMNNGSGVDKITTNMTFDNVGRFEYNSFKNNVINEFNQIVENSVKQELENQQPEQENPEQEVPGQEESGAQNGAVKEDEVVM